MGNVTILDKTFSISISSEEIQKRIGELATRMNVELKGKKPLFIGVLNGSFLFAADLFRKIEGDAEITFIRVSSYSGTSSSGVVTNVMGLTSSIEGRTVVLVEDIVDTGETAVHLIEELEKQKPEKIYFASLLLKPDALKHPIRPEYIGFEVPNDFLVGYGLDYNGLGRNLEDIYKLA